MTEDEVNKRCKQWLESKGFKYKGVLNNGLGQVPIPDGTRNVLIDHQGVKQDQLIWIEAKGSNNGVSDFLQGFIRVCMAVYYGGGDGYLGIPSDAFETMKVYGEFLNSVATVVDKRGKLGLLNAESGQVKVLG